MYEGVERPKLKGRGLFIATPYVDHWSLVWPIRERESSATPQQQREWLAEINAWS
jgi:hypothetical protein